MFAMSMSLLAVIQLAGLVWYLRRLERRIDDRIRVERRLSR